jgi:hypothetical protein
MNGKPNRLALPPCSPNAVQVISTLDLGKAIAGESIALDDAMGALNLEYQENNGSFEK